MTVIGCSQTTFGPNLTFSIHPRRTGGGQGKINRRHVVSSSPRRSSFNFSQYRDGRSLAFPSFFFFFASELFLFGREEGGFCAERRRLFPLEFLCLIFTRSRKTPTRSPEASWILSTSRQEVCIFILSLFSSSSSSSFWLSSSLFSYFAQQQQRQQHLFSPSCLQEKFVCLIESIVCEFQGNCCKSHPPRLFPDLGV